MPPGRVPIPACSIDTTINQWHTSPAGGAFSGSNPCSEYMFLDDTACNLASLNLVKFYDDESGDFDIDGYRTPSAVDDRARDLGDDGPVPVAEIAQGSYDYRTLGLGYANLGSLLMRMGIPYDSDEGRAIAGALTAILTGTSYATSAEMATALGPFPRFEENRDIDAAGHAQPSPSRLRLGRGLRGRHSLRHADRPRQAPADLLEAARSPGITQSRSWRTSTATATPRRRCWRRPGPSAC